MKLFKIQNPFTLYVIAENEKKARLQLEGSDSGGEDYEQFIQTTMEGAASELTSLKQVEEDDYDLIPYGGDITDDYYGCSIIEYFAIKKDEKTGKEPEKEPEIFAINCQESYCNSCGKRYLWTVRNNFIDGRGNGHFCSKECQQEHFWKEALSILNKTYSPQKSKK